MAIAPKTRIWINVAAFLVLGAGLSYAMATQVLAVLQDRMSVFAIFPDAGGVFKNQEVTYRGITVGQVGDMSVVDEGVRIELLIESDQQIPKEDIHARVMFKSAVGEQFVELEPASDDAPYLAHGDVIPLENTSIPVSTQELLSTLQRVLEGVPPEALEGAVDNLGAGLTGRGQDIARIIESTAELADLFAQRSPETIGILKNGTTVGGAFIRSRRDFIRAIGELVPVSQSLAENTTNLRRLLEGANLTSDEVLALLRENRPDIDAFLATFADVNELQANHVDDLSILFKYLPSALNRVSRSFEPRTGLIRFGLVTDIANPGCDYGTQRRVPENRAEQKPPLKARCGGGGNNGDPSLLGGLSNGSIPSDDAPAQPEAGSSPTGSLTGILPDTDVLTGTPSLPARMSNWSWTLFYLNGV
ncbi:MAG TPA: MCE family protein [Actinomycetota bacterium]|jgi:phospholipid/cholesterol/gamma-HCH transport system substrate-binding protein